MLLSYPFLKLTEIFNGKTDYPSRESKPDDNLPVQFVPLPSYPVWHSQSNEPMVLVQFALKPHGLSLHSFISVKDGKGNFLLRAKCDVAIIRVYLA